MLLLWCCIICLLTNCACLPTFTQDPLGMLDIVALNLYTLFAVCAVCTFWTYQPLILLRKAVDHSIIYELWDIKNYFSQYFDSNRKSLGKHLHHLVTLVILFTLVTFTTNFNFFTNIKLDFKVHLSSMFHDFNSLFHSLLVLFHFHSLHFHLVLFIFVLLLSPCFVLSYPWFCFNFYFTTLLYFCDQIDSIGWNIFELSFDLTPAFWPCYTFWVTRSTSFALTGHFELTIVSFYWLHSAPLIWIYNIMGTV